MQCCAFGQTEDRKYDYVKKNFEYVSEFIKFFGVYKDAKRYLVRCKKCKALFIYQCFSTEVGQKECFHEVYLQVKDIDEAKRINESTNWEEFMSQKNLQIVHDTYKDLNKSNNKSKKLIISIIAIIILLLIVIFLFCN
jgi:hypothetical protein